MSAVQINNVVKRYGSLEVVHGINLSIEPQEFVVLVGPSGCGKSTTLRMLAGLEDISAGTVCMDGREVNKIAPKDRDVAMVFQNYALYPHLSVADNIAFGLRVRGEKKAAINKAVTEAAQILGLTEYLSRKPADLSGGQRQRVAMGRAIVRQPKIFLFDEPLSNLDAKLRTHMRTEIKHLHQRMRATSIYVTHDQVEAMTLADRIVIMNGGRIEQVGAPMDVFLEPANTFVASFIGSPPMNLLDGKIEKQNGQVTVRLSGQDGQSILIPDDFARHASEGQPVKLGLRPEIMGVEAGKNRTILACNIDLVEPLGAEALLHGKINGQSFIAKADTLYGEHDLTNINQIAIDIPRIHVFDAASGKTLKNRDGFHS